MIVDGTLVVNERRRRNVAPETSAFSNGSLRIVSTFMDMTFGDDTGGSKLRSLRTAASSSVDSCKHDDDDVRE